MEIVTTLLILLALCIVLVVLDLVVGGLVALLTSLTFKKVFICGLWSLLLPPLMLAYGFFIERNCFTVKELELKYAELPQSFDGYTIVHISDIHSQSFADRVGRLRKAVEKVNGLKPDLILFTGDVITISPSELDSTASVLSMLHAKDGVVSVLGNHDYCMYMNGRMHQSVNRNALEELKEREEKMGWRLLCNESHSVHRGSDSIVIAGVENITPSKHFPSTGNLQKAAEGTYDSFRILLSHDPKHWDTDAEARKFHLTLSGHTHACQFSFFGLTPAAFTYKHYRGLYEDDTSHRYLYVNPGLGETLFPARIGVMPEITVIRLRNDNRRL